MPTRDEFLANPGLVPQDGESQCMICHETAVEPVMTSGCECRVVYCRECILEWFRSGSGKCPTCIVQHFTIPGTEDSEDSEDDDSSDEDYDPGYTRLYDEDEEYEDDGEDESSIEDEPRHASSVEYMRWMEIASSQWASWHQS
ncbi:uncharacterized protein RHO25_012813 [Cercospora beticola]|uniref:RING-type domain-containing protein n=1 Tax=Cercospora beticola TaxID=122368 RepID=A0ABZ0P9J7_CERBT|nr:hypothetical protein RHO25_012813 [Cercospora beticola]CAK1367981.1 unnamed protein product [Cercospora beticola]